MIDPVVVSVVLGVVAGAFSMGLITGYVLRGLQK